MQYIEEIKSSLRGSFVLFSHGTVMMMSDRDAAIRELQKHGPVHVGSCSGDFKVIKIEEGWIIAYDYGDMLTFISKKEMDPNTPDYKVGLLGRDRRELDAEELKVVHVEKR